MKHSLANRLPAFLSMAFCAFVLFPAWVHAASADAPDIDDDLRAKIQKEKVKTNKDKHGAGDEMGNSGMEDMNASNSNCDINIGNQNSSQKGTNGIASRDQTVIVTGPVVNTGNCSKH